MYWFVLISPKLKCHYSFTKKRSPMETETQKKKPVKILKNPDQLPNGKQVESWKICK